MSAPPHARTALAAGLARLVRLAVLVLLCVWGIFPLYWAFTLSIKQPLDFFNGSLIPFLSFPPTLDSWSDEVIYFVDQYGRDDTGPVLASVDVVQVVRHVDRDAAFGYAHDVELGGVVRSDLAGPLGGDRPAGIATESDRGGPADAQVGLGGLEIGRASCRERVCNDV